MFNNIGGKIKGFAEIICWLGIIGSIISGIILIAIGISIEHGGVVVFLGILIAIAGSISSWIGSFFTYGFGQLIENSDTLVKQGNTPVAAKTTPTDETTITTKATVTANGTWICGNCKTENDMNYGQCKKCGKFRY